MDQRISSSSFVVVSALVILGCCGHGLRAQDPFFSTMLAFDGEDDYVQADVAAIPPTGDFTICLWAKAVSFPARYAEIVSQHGGPTGRHFYLGKAASGNIRAGDSWNETGVPFPVDGDWHHYALVKSSSDTRLYVDGLLRASAGRAIVQPAGSEFRIARQYGGHGEYFHGSVDEISIWNIVLDAHSIRRIMHTTSIDGSWGLVSYWQLDEGAGGTFRDSVTGSSGVLHNMGSGNWPLSTVPLAPAQIIVDLPGRDDTDDETITIPNGRPAYAFLVSGFQQNANFDMFHFYAFAKCLLLEDAYVHYSRRNPQDHPQSR